jgi:predicted membrane protein (TIGR00267 family)
MPVTERLRRALDIGRPGFIARRYFVTNGFDGALTLLGLLMGFRVGDQVMLDTAVAAGFGTAVALGVSGLSSAYVSETAERQQELDGLREAMVDQLDDSAHAHAALLAPMIVALVNGLSPFLIAQVIMLPLWLAMAGVPLPASPVDLGIATALALVFLLGVFLGRISRTFWLWAGLRSTALALVTVGLIWAFSP